MSVLNTFVSLDAAQSSKSSVEPSNRSSAQRDNIKENDDTPKENFGSHFDRIKNEESSSAEATKRASAINSDRENSIATNGELSEATLVSESILSNLQGEDFVHESVQLHEATVVASEATQQILSPLLVNGVFDPNSGVNASNIVVNSRFSLQSGINQPNLSEHALLLANEGFSTDEPILSEVKPAAAVNNIKLTNITSSTLLEGGRFAPLNVSNQQTLLPELLTKTNLLPTELTAKPDITPNNFASIISGLTATPTELKPASILPTQLVLNQSLSSPSWGADVADKVLWLASQGLKEAEIQLDPPELGPLQARVIVHQDQAQVVFNSHSAQVREALDQQAARLREMFASEGLNLVDVDVSDQSFQQSEQAEDSHPQLSSQSNLEELEEEHTQNLTPLKVSQFLVDRYV